MESPTISKRVAVMARTSKQLPAREHFRSVSRLRQQSCYTAGAALLSLVKFVSFAACRAVVAQVPDEGE